MKLDYTDIINSSKDKTGLCLALGPSLRPYLDTLNTLQNNKVDYCILSVSDFDLMFDLNVEYRVIANNIFTIQNDFHQINNNPAKVLYASTVDLTPPFIVEQLTVDYLPYDQRNFGSGNTIQEKLQEYTGHSEHYSTADTVALHMIAYSILMGCKTIYVFGMDLDYTKGYVKPGHFNPDTFTPWLSNILSDLKIIRESADKIGVKIYSCCEGSPINTVIQYKNFEV